MDLIIRENTYDIHILDEVKTAYSWMTVIPGDVVFDAGANIGASVRMFLDLGAKVVAYEPDDENFELLVKNVSEAELHHAALVEDGKTSVTMFVNPGRNKGIHSLLFHRKRIEKTVSAINFQAELIRVNPTILKVDVEGYEHVLLENAIIPDVTRQMTIEFDLRKDGNSSKKHPRDLLATRHHVVEVVNHLMSQGFTFIRDSTTFARFSTTRKRVVLVCLSRELPSDEKTWLTQKEFNERLG